MTSLTSFVLEKLRLSLRFAAITFVALLAFLPIEGHSYTPNIQYYYIDSAFNENQVILISLALDYIEYKVGCVEYREVREPGIFTVGSLDFYKLPGPIEEKEKGMVIGYYSTPIHNIFLSDKIYNGGDVLVDMPPSYFFKLIIHEVAHSLGMPGKHAFPKEFKEVSQLTPVVGKYSEPRYYEKDVQYLRKLVCGK